MLINENDLKAWLINMSRDYERNKSTYLESKDQLISWAKKQSEVKFNLTGKELDSAANNLILFVLGDHDNVFEKKLAESQYGPETELDDSLIMEAYQKKTKPSTKTEVTKILMKESISDADKEILYSWEGEGSVKSADSKTGILHEFFTPYWLCLTISEIVNTLGINSDKVLDPSAGTGRLLRYLKFKKAICFERNKFNADIAQKLYPGVEMYNQDFETAFLKEPRYNALAKEIWVGNDFDLVVANPPYGEYSGEYKSLMPKLFTRFEFLFVELTMSLVKSGGSGIYILPQSFMNNGNMYNKQKEAIMKKCSFVDAIRLPNKIFASTDIGVDLLILRKK